MKPTVYLQRWRTQLMGIAAIWIVLLHTHYAWPGRILNAALNIYGSVGVDMFVFLMGFGLAFALEKRRPFGEYYARRASRILPAYYLALGAGTLMTGYYPRLGSVMAHIIPIGVWVGFKGYWYIHACLVFYLMAPLLWRMLRFGRWPRLAMIAQLLFFCVALPCATDGYAAEAVQRMPALAVGIAAGVFHHIHGGRRDGWIDALTYAAITCLGALLIRHPGALSRPLAFVSRTATRQIGRDLLAVGISLVFALACELMERCFLRVVNRALSCAGRRSLEIYLVHLVVEFIARHRLHLSATPVLAAMLLLSYPLALLMAKGSELLLAGWRRLIRFFAAPQGTAAARGGESRENE